MSRDSAGVILWRWAGLELEVLLVHPGGPFWAKKDAGAWSIPKGEAEPDEPASVTARREFQEETGQILDGELVDLGEIRQAGGKRVRGFAAEGDLDPATIKSATFEMEWPPRSGRTGSFPEIDRAAWFGLETARAKLIKGQVPLLDRLAAQVDALQARRVPPST